MRFHNKPYLDYCKLKIDELEVSRVQVIKFLGVLVDEKLSWSNRINPVCKHIYIIYKVKHLYMLYCLLILPYISCACEI